MPTLGFEVLTLYAKDNQAKGNHDFADKGKKRRFERHHECRLQGRTRSPLDMHLKSD